VLALGAIFAGWLAAEFFVGDQMAGFWGRSILMLDNVIEEAHHAPAWVVWLPTGMAAIGIVAAWIMYIAMPGWPGQLAAKIRPVYQFVFSKWYFDELYDAMFVRLANYIGRGLWKSGDGALIDGVGPDGIAAAVIDLARWATRLQSGYLYHYAFAMLMGVAGLVTWYLLAGG
jgi:NADH-quinone oxidoreductase subunit L